MKHKQIEKTPPVKTRKGGWATTVQEVDGITVLNIFVNKNLTVRHCVDVRTGEHETWHAEKPAHGPVGAVSPYWSTENIYGAYNIGEYWERWNTRYSVSNGREKRQRFMIADRKTEKELEKKIREANKRDHWMDSSWDRMLDQIETDYDRDKRENAQQRKIRRINDLMEEIGVCGLPHGFLEWGADKAMGGMHVAIYEPGSEKWGCSGCGIQAERWQYVDTAGQQVKTYGTAICPNCGKPVYMCAKSKNEVTRYYDTDVCLLQNTSDDFSVMRHFKIRTECTATAAHDIDWHETVRLIMYRDDPRGRNYKIYYNHCRASKPLDTKRTYYGYDSFGCEDWGEHNPANHRIVSEYMWSDPVGIRQALKGTHYAEWERCFPLFATCGMKLNYNNLMACADRRIADIAELLFKGRFYHLLFDTSERIWTYAGSYFGALDIKGSNILEVMQTDDMQMINRLRNIDGGESELHWLRWAAANGKKISQATLEWIVKNKVTLMESDTMLKYFTPEQMMNYVMKQRGLGYKGFTPTQIMGQYGDYISMAAKLGKKLEDELIYKPTDLKLRHDEYVEECTKRAAAIEARQNKDRARRMAKDMRKRFPESEKILVEIKPLLEWENEDYKIIVPKTLVDIIFEGNQLHHCAGSTDRYFDRICQHETYICFLRKKDKPKEPYYTIEVEPGGVIRQHRGAFDEEPEIEKVKPALKEWQREIRKRMKKKDRERAKESERKRVENIAYLKEHINEKNNRRVLAGLEEDLMAL